MNSKRPNFAGDNNEYYADNFIASETRTCLSSSYNKKYEKKEHRKLIEKLVKKFLIRKDRAEFP